MVTWSRPMQVFSPESPQLSQGRLSRPQTGPQAASKTLWAFGGAQGECGGQGDWLRSDPVGLTMALPQPTHDSTPTLHLMSQNKPPQGVK